MSSTTANPAQQGVPLTRDNPPGPPHPRVTAAIDSWKRDLLDLSKRNRGLNFKQTKLSTIAIVGHDPATVFRHLYLRELVAHFSPAKEGLPPALLEEARDSEEMSLPFDLSATASSGFGGDEDADVNDEPKASPGSAATAPPARAALPGGWLQTALPPEHLEKSLRQIEERARLTMEEQGVNTLFIALGMLQYTESESSEQTFRAPLVLLPATLERKSARAAYTLKGAEDDPLVNAALVEYLRKSFGVVLPELPDAEAIPEDYDLTAWYAAARDALGTRRNWAITDDIYLGHFSFQKLVMYNDIEITAESLAAHPLIRLVTGDPAATESQSGGMPGEVREMDLDEDYAPEATNQVVDADASQLRAMAAVAKNYSLVIEGPPGTGKSQTITNLIARGLAAGKSVLFVAEKMAALQVVHRRLAEAGLGEFCLELHSTKANKLAVIKEIGRSLDASMARVDTRKTAADRIASVRTTLTEYVRALHRPHGPLGMSPFEAYGALGQVHAAPRLKYDGPVETVTRPDLEQAVRSLIDLTTAARDIGVPGQHPWRDAKKAFFSEDDLDSIRDLANDLVGRLASLRRSAIVAEATCGLSRVGTLSELAASSAVADVIAQSPGAPMAVLGSDFWNSPPADAVALVSRGRSMRQLRDRLRQRFTPAVEEKQHGDDIAYVERCAGGLARLFAGLRPRYRRIRHEWTAYRGAKL